MTTVHTSKYDGPERRSELIIGQCACHLKHEAAIMDHTEQIKDIAEQLRHRVPWRLFALFVSIVVISTGFIYREIRATSLQFETRLDYIDMRIDSRIDRIDKDLHAAVIREDIFEKNTRVSLSEIKDAIRTINDNLDRHMHEIRRLNGIDSKAERK